MLRWQFLETCLGTLHILLADFLPGPASAPQISGRDTGPFLAGVVLSLQTSDFARGCCLDESRDGGVSLEVANSQKRCPDLFWASGSLDCD